MYTKKNKCTTIISTVMIATLVVAGDCGSAGERNSRPSRSTMLTLRAERLC